jgi:hypothetical protein
MLPGCRCYENHELGGDKDTSRYARLPLEVSVVAHPLTSMRRRNLCGATLGRWVTGSPSLEEQYTRCR